MKTKDKIIIFSGAIAICLNIVSTGGVYWQQDAVTHENMGLWKTCKHGKCGTLKEHPDWRVTCQTFLLASCLLNFICVNMSILCLPCKEKSRIPFVGSLLAALFCASGLIVYSANASGAFGWSYYCSWSTVLLLVINGFYGCCQ
ncbi:claudin domain-containing protein 2-like [Hydractinia symbiolongicarpus]|uniref:claudin domain-containing protein 2-like n=1 Tax=Hydractinia symbiolongicarpus TaxID=13093 RepID=UPI00254ACBDB|nr:claudin domain-containing protein 2-like [Hydractinia symbiolongicarpus]